MMVSPKLLEYICLVERAKYCMDHGLDLQIEVPLPWKRPKGFPRGELLCVNSRGNQVYAVNAKKAYDFFKVLEMEAKSEMRPVPRT